MFLSRVVAAIVLAGFSLAALSAAPKPPPGEGAPTGPGAKPKLQFEVSITHGGKTTKSPTAAAAMTKIQSIQKLIARGAKAGDKPPAEGDKPAEGASDFSAVFTLNGETKEVGDPAEAEKVCKRINEAMVAARKKGEDLSTLTIPTDDGPMAEALPAGGAEGKGPRRPIRGKNGEGPMPNANNPMNPMGPFAGGPPPMGPFGPGTIPPKQGGNNGGGLEALMEHVPPQLRPIVMQRLAQYRQQNNGAFPDPNTIMQIIGQVMKQAQQGGLPPMGLPPAPKQP